MSEMTPGVGSSLGQPYDNPGPIGEQRNILKQFLLSVVTLSLYGLFWAYRNHEDIHQHTGSGISGVVGVLIYFFAGIITLFLLPLEIKRMYDRDGQQSPVSAATAFWILAFGIPWYVKCQGAMNRYWASKGAPPPP
jgi:hypothetical protein